MGVMTLLWTAGSEVNWEYKGRNAFFGTFAKKGTSPALQPPPG